jgi:hypothetical protein
VKPCSPSCANKQTGGGQQRNEALAAHAHLTAEAAIPFRIFNDLKVLESDDSEMVPRRGLEPPRPCDRQHLKLVRLPIPPSGHGVGGALSLHG